MTRTKLPPYKAPVTLQTHTRHSTPDRGTSQDVFHFLRRAEDLAGPTGIFDTLQSAVDDSPANHQTPAMKYLPHFLLGSLTAISLASCAETGGGGGGATAGSESQLGPHSGQKFIMCSHMGARVFNENDPNYAKNIALIVRIEQRMVGGQQEIAATAASHKDGPGGKPFAVEGLQIHVTQPVDFKSTPRKTGEVKDTNSIPASGGKFKTVVAEASINSPDYGSQKVSITIPGDQ